jgi:hypothetical protein
MIELPGSFSGIEISPRPERGPLASQRTSLAILVSEAAMPLTHLLHFRAPLFMETLEFTRS